MTVDIIISDTICDYCRNRENYKNTGYSCNFWYRGDKCDNSEDFSVKELIEVINDS